MRTLIILVVIALAFNESLAQWEVTVGKEKVTNKQMAFLRTQGKVNGQLYELQLTCGEGSLPKIQVAAFDQNLSGRKISFEEQSSFFGVSLWSRRFNFRVDDRKPQSLSLSQKEYGNMGETIWPTSEDMPQRRIVISEVIPGETVEFKVSPLSRQVFDLCSKPVLAERAKR